MVSLMKLMSNSMHTSLRVQADALSGALQILMFLSPAAPDLSSRDALLLRTERTVPQAPDPGRLCGATDGVEHPRDISVPRRRYSSALGEEQTTLELCYTLNIIVCDGRYCT